MTAKGQRSRTARYFAGRGSSGGFRCCRVLGVPAGPSGFAGPRRLDGATAYLPAAAFGVLPVPSCSGVMVFRISSANLRWLASNCSAKS
jgi:hypothetical protein